MANMLDELDEKIMEEGREVNVIAKQIKVEKDASIQILIWALYLIGLGLIAFGAVKNWSWTDSFWCCEKNILYYSCGDNNSCLCLQYIKKTGILF